MSMDSTWMPPWLAVCGVTAYALVLAVHLWHAWHLTRLGRLWHLGHVLMGLGMVDMFWPGPMPVGPRAGEVVFAVAALVAAGLVTSAVRCGDWRIWSVAVVDLSGMTYMFMIADHPLLLLTVVFVAWTAAETALWASGAALDVLGLRSRDPQRGPGHGSGSSWNLRLSLAVMSLGMAVMFLAV